MVDRSKVRVLIVDDHPLFRLGLAMALRDVGFGTIEESVDGLHAVEICRGRRFDVILLDLRMPRMNGIEAARRLRSMRSADDPFVLIMLTTFDEPAILRAAKQAGITAFLGKETEPNDVAMTIDRLLAGTRTLIHEPTDFPTLTDREHDVLLCLAHGASVKAAGQELGISAETVKDHVSGIYAKLGVRDRVSAIHEARRLGILLLEEISGELDRA